MGKPEQQVKMGHLFVIIQFTLIGLLIYFGSLESNYTRTFVMVTGILLGVWAIWSMKFRVSIFPEVNHVENLTVSGPYTVIRHPMYTAVLLTTLAFVTNSATFGLWLLLFADLFLKLNYEEKLLTSKFASYKKYQKTTKKLIPFIY